MQTYLVVPMRCHGQFLVPIRVAFDVLYLFVLKQISQFLLPVLRQNLAEESKWRGGGGR